MVLVDQARPGRGSHMNAATYLKVLEPLRHAFVHTPAPRRGVSAHRPYPSTRRRAPAPNAAARPTSGWSWSCSFCPTHLPPYKWQNYLLIKQLKKFAWLQLKVLIMRG